MDWFRKRFILLRNQSTLVDLFYWLFFFYWGISPLCLNRCQVKSEVKSVTRCFFWEASVEAQESVHPEGFVLLTFFVTDFFFTKISPPWRIYFEHTLHAHTHTNTHTHTHTDTHTHAHTHTNSWYTHIYINIFMLMWSTHNQTHSHTHTQTHIVCIHTYTHTLIL